MLTKLTNWLRSVFTPRPIVDPAAERAARIKANRSRGAKAGWAKRKAGEAVRQVAPVTSPTEIGGPTPDTWDDHSEDALARQRVSAGWLSEDYESDAMQAGA